MSSQTSLNFFEHVDSSSSLRWSHPPLTPAMILIFSPLCHKSFLLNVAPVSQPVTWCQHVFCGTTFSPTRRQILHKHLYTGITGVSWPLLMFTCCSHVSGLCRRCGGVVLCRVAGVTSVDDWLPKLVTAVWTHTTNFFVRNVMTCSLSITCISCTICIIFIC